ncbi:Phosphatidylinositol-glycan biosynthesis class F protein [Linum perenne]
MKDKKRDRMHEEACAPVEASECNISILQAIMVHAICGLGLATGLWISHINLVSHPSDTIFLIWIVETPAALLLYSYFRKGQEKHSFLRAIGRGILAFPIGALIHAAVAIVLGAPVGSRYVACVYTLHLDPSFVVGYRYLLKTINWSLLMSSLTVVPVASVYGSSWADWQRLLACTKPNGSLEYMLCIPAHGAVIGAWLGAWPMPLDWERPWQEWPICVTYGSLVGYVVGMVASVVVVLASSTGVRRRLKGD